MFLGDARWPTPRHSVDSVELVSMFTDDLTIDILSLHAHRGTHLSLTDLRVCRVGTRSQTGKVEKAQERVDLRQCMYSRMHEVAQ